MMPNPKWKFFLTHGECMADSPGAWWLKLTTAKEIARYIEITEGRFSDATMRVCNLYSEIDEHSEKKADTISDFQHNAGALAQSLDILHCNSGQTLLTDAGKFYEDITSTYFKIFDKFGFVNVNRNGGCNGLDWTHEAIVYRDNLVFPQFTQSDIRVKTQEMGELKYAGVIRDNYQYHYYAYVGDVQVTEGEKIKWDTYDAAYDAAKRYCSQNGC